MESAPLKTWELSLYETKRRPQEAITDDTEIAVSPRALHSELMCPICLDILKHTMTTKECLHRFCQVCIITALRSGNKECPTCRKKLVSKRSLRHDPNFDQLIAKIYPSREEFEAHEERVLAKLSKFATSVSCDSAVSGGRASSGVAKKRQRSSAQQQLAPNQQDDNASSLASDDNNAKRSRGGGGVGGNAASEEADSCCLDSGSLCCASSSTGCRRQVAASANATAAATATAAASSSAAAGPPASAGRQDIELLLKPLPTWSEGRGAETKYLKTVRTATVAHLVSYLRLRHSLDHAASASASASAVASADASAAEDASAVAAAAAAAAAASADVAGEAAYAIYCGRGGGGGGGYQRLSDPAMSLEQIRDRFWSANRVLDLYFERVAS